MGLDLIKPRRRKGLPEESLADFVQRRLGREGLERLAQPLVGGIYTADPKRLSLRATMPQFVDMEQEHRSLILAMRARSKQQQSAAAAGPRYGLFVTLKQGLGAVTARMAEELSDQLHYNALIDACRRNAQGRWEIYRDGSLVNEVEHLVLALPAHRIAHLLRDDSLLHPLLGGIPYADIATVNVALREQDIERLPQAAGFVVPAVDHQAMIACTFVHHKYEHRAPAGHVLLRAFCGGAMHADDLQFSDAELCQRVLGELHWRFGLKGQPLFIQVQRWLQAMAQYELGHLRRCDLIDQALALRPGLHLLGNGMRGVGIPDVVGKGWQVVENILQAAS
jgi:oxygen-dependent protoporphyrinogen oxidase